MRGLVGKIKVKNTVTVSQEKVLQETSDKLQKVEKELQSSQQQLSTREEEVRPPTRHPVDTLHLTVSRSFMNLLIRIITYI